MSLEERIYGTVKLRRNNKCIQNCTLVAGWNFTPHSITSLSLSVYPRVAQDNAVVHTYH